MIYLIQSNAVQKLKRKEASPAGPISLIELISNKSGVLSFEDQDYDMLVDLFLYCGLDFKVVISYPSVPTYGSVLNERRSELLITFLDYLKDTDSKEEYDLNDLVDKETDSDDEEL